MSSSWLSKASFRMELRDRNIWIEEGEFLIVPRGASNTAPWRRKKPGYSSSSRPHTLNTGNVQNELTLPELERA